MRSILPNAQTISNGIARQGCRARETRRESSCEERPDAALDSAGGWTGSGAMRRAGWLRRLFMVGWACVGLGLGVQACQGQEPGTTLIASNSIWHYRKGTNEASSPIGAWRSGEFDVSKWSRSAAPFYYGGSGITGGTLVSDMRYNYTTLFLRQSFVLTNASRVEDLRFQVWIDDGFIVWVNGREAARYNVYSGEPKHTNGTPLAINRLLVSTNNTTTVPFLQDGTNWLAVQLFNRNLTSSDLYLTLEMTAGLRDENPPRIASVDPAPGRLDALSRITVTFTEPVRGVSAEDLWVQGAPATELEGAGAAYTFGFSRPADGLVDVAWDIDHQIADLSGNPFSGEDPAHRWQYELVDAVAPAVLSVTPVEGSTVGRLEEIRVLFSEPVRGIDAGDLRVNDEPAAGIEGDGAGPYRFLLSGVASGLVRLRWAADHGITDLASAPNAFAGGEWTCTLDPDLLLSQLIISEFMAANVSDTGWKDEDGDLHDWIEIHNRGSNVVDLLGWSLTDDADSPDEWVFPARILGPGGHLVVFASGKDRRPVGTLPLHTNFKLSAAGEHLALLSPEQPRRVVSAFAPAYPEQRADYSYGLTPAGALGYFARPTPGASNVAATPLAGVVARPRASVASGFYTEPMQVYLACETPLSRIYYTLDGREPTAVNGIAYSGPLTVAGTPERAVVNLRAVAVREDYLPSKVLTHSYIFPEHVLAQPSNPAGFPSAWVTQSGTTIPADYGMDPRVTGDPAYRDLALQALTDVPTLSLVMDTADLFDRQRGLYSNPGGAGIAWERPVSAEFLFVDGSGPVQIDAGLRLQGGTSREPNKVHKHSLRLLFRGDYGASKLEHRLFPDSPVERFDTLVLDARLNNVWHYRNTEEQRTRADYVRDQYAADMQAATGWPSPYGRLFQVYLNGLYWGTMWVHERPDASFAASYFGGEKEQYDSLKNTTGFEVLDGDRAAWDQALALANSGLAENSQYEALQRYVDVTNLADYMLTHLYLANTDWPHHNWYVARKRETNAQFKFFMWDGEHIMKSETADRTGVNNSGTPAQFYDQLRRNNAEFRLLFADRAHRHFFNGGAFYSDPARPQWDPAHPERNRPAAAFARRIAEMDPSIVLESARWGDNARPDHVYTRNVEWLAEVNWMIGTFLSKRSAIMIGQLKSAGLYPANSVAPVFDPHGGRVPAGFKLSMQAPAGIVYYTTDGTDPRVYGAGSVSPSAQRYSAPVPLHGWVRVKARTLNGSEWSALNEADFQVGLAGSPLRFTEVMYHPAGGDPYEFVELMNAGAHRLSLGGMVFDSVQFAFPADQWLEPGGILVLAANAASFSSRYPGVAPAGYFGGNLANSGERIVLRDAAGAIVAAVAYDDQYGWPQEADGGGRSLEIRDLLGDPDDPANWQSSSAIGGSPGFLAPPRPAGSVRISEIMAHNVSAIAQGGSYPDWIELHNAGPDRLNLAGWSLTDNDDPRRFVFPDPTILEGGAFLVVWCGLGADAGPSSASFNLDRDGERILLYDDRTNCVDVATYGPQVADFSLGRAGDVWQLALPTPGDTNQAAALADTSNLLLNEWLANARPGEPDWLEIRNGDPSLPASIAGVYLVSGLITQQLRAPVFVAPGGHVRLWADEVAFPGHLAFKLPASGARIMLLDDQAGLVDSIEYGPQTEAVSEGRFPDGGAAIVAFPSSSSPGAPNFLPEWTGPVLNEFMARNHGRVRDPAGRTADWIELWNPGAAGFDLSGMSLALPDSGGWTWRFPAGAVVAGGGWLVVWFDDNRPASAMLEEAMNSGHALAGESGAIELRDAAGRTVSAVRYGWQAPDYSVGQADGAWRLLAEPTPGGENSSAAALSPATAVRFNEWMALPVDGCDWFELYHPGDGPVDLSGLWLADDPSVLAVDRHVIPPLSFIGPHGWIQFLADGQPGQGAHHVGFALDGWGESLQLYDADGWLLDRVDFGPQSVGVSEGLWPDGAGNRVFFRRMPSPAGANVADPDAPADRDGDGMPDAWESGYGLNPDDSADGSEDRDGDGLSNGEEYLAGTRPDDPSSVLDLWIETEPLGGVVLRFAAQAGRSYRIETADGLGTGWETLRAFEAKPFGQEMALGDPAGQGIEQRLYRLVIAGVEDR